jgi:formylglycine-generating enzyme required for sulfatase activity
VDLYPVSNREYLAFVTAHPTWKKSQIAKTSHDGDYLKHWLGDDIIKAKDMNRPVRYVSYFAAMAYCKSRGKSLPWMRHYYAAANDAREGVRVIYDTPYTAPDFNFMRMEWSDGWYGAFAGIPDPGKRIPYQHGSIHRANSRSPHYVPEEVKQYTGRSLGFRCVER